MCQALGIPSFEKYQSDGGPGIIQIMNLLNESQRREEDRDLFIKAQILFYLLAAIDGHAKNFSLRWGPQGFWMTPLYDILSAQPIVKRGDLQYEKIKMSMGVGSRPHWKVSEIFRRHFIQSATQAKYEQKRLEKIIDEILGQISGVIKKVSSSLPSDFPEKVALSIFSGMKQRSSHLKNVASSS
jgi:serine/threonine-protein kinase HipA